MDVTINCCTTVFSAVQQFLVLYRQSLQEQIRQLKEHEIKLEEKIAYYQQELDAKSAHSIQ